MGRFALLPILFVIPACWPEDQTPQIVTLQGETMGTTYNVTTVGGPDTLDEASLKQAIDQALTRVNAAMNNWDPSSEVSQFNARDDSAAQKISADFVTVMQTANEIHSLSGGAFDVTLGPVISLWGFGPRSPDSPLPNETDLAAAMALTGQAQLLSLTDDGLAKSDPSVSVNLSAIAKGYGVDAIAAEIAALGVNDYIVEIGGDLAAKGNNPDGVPWRIAIERPTDTVDQTQSVQQVVGITDLGMATSGDYRNYFEQDGVRYSHIIDATTGRPVTHKTASVTVLAPSAMEADGWATALLALGSEKALPIAEAQGLAVFAIDRGPEGDFITVASPAFEAILNGTD
ncbi:MAG: FAD:protein FMN transferase [Mangrovicoccus sp.]|nr:FAD:protein FMN transferase [Mangrovicoccus sp.]